MVFFEEELEKRTGGRIQVENYFSALLGNEREVMDMVATGAVQGTRGGFFADANPMYNILALPFLVDNWDQLLRLINSEFVGAINRGARGNGYHIPACGVSQGFRNHTNSVRPILTPDDFAGLKMRVPAQEPLIVTARVLGMNPQELPFVEVYQAAKTGVIDGQDNAASNIWDMKVFEVQRYFTISNYSTGPDPFMVNLAWFETLPADLQETFDEVAREAIIYSDELNRESEEVYTAKLAERLETNTIVGENLVKFQEKAREVYEYFVEKGAFTWDQIEAAKRAAREGTT